MANDQHIIIREATIDDMPLISALAREIWPNTYKNILSNDQLEYMLELICSISTLQKQFYTGHNFLIAEEDKPVAFAEYNRLKDSVYKLQKIYVLPEQHGKGIGKLLINYVTELVKAKLGTALLLNVNRHNKAKEFYEHLGFIIIGEEDIDIGQGFYMNDYIMEKLIV